jgi:hypothetical protein
MDWHPPNLYLFTLLVVFPIIAFLVQSGVNILHRTKVPAKLLNINGPHKVLDNISRIFAGVSLKGSILFEGFHTSLNLAHRIHNNET